MRHALALVSACGALAVTIACSRGTSYDRDMQPSPGQGYAVETTGAVIGSDDIRKTDEPDVTLDEAAARLAGQICAREVRCHVAPGIAGPCMASYHDRARGELARWRCSPAAARARVKECLATIGEEPCALDLSKRTRLCGGNEECPAPGARLIAPGAAIADAGL